MHSNEQNHSDTRASEHEDHRDRASLARRIRLVGRLMRAETERALPSHTPPSRGEVKAARREIEARAADAVSPEALETTLATLDAIAEALGGRDALPFHTRGGRGFGGRGFGHRGRGHRGFAFPASGFEHHGFERRHGDEPHGHRHPRAHRMR